MRQQSMRLFCSSVIPHPLLEASGGGADRPSAQIVLYLPQHANRVESIIRQFQYGSSQFAPRRVKMVQDFATLGVIVLRFKL